MPTVYRPTCVFLNVNECLKKYHNTFGPTSTNNQVFQLSTYIVGTLKVFAYNIIYGPFIPIFMEVLILFLACKVTPVQLKADKIVNEK